MKGNYPIWVYILITLSGGAVLTMGTVMELNITANAIGAGLFAYGANRLIREWRKKKNPEYAKKLENANNDERLAYIADKSRSLTLIIAINVLALSGVVLISTGLKSYGNACLYIMMGISLLYFIIYNFLSRRY